MLLSLDPAFPRSPFCALAPLVLFVIAGFHWVLRRPAVAKWAVPARGQAFASVLIALFAFETFSVPRQARRGFLSLIRRSPGRWKLLGLYPPYSSGAAAEAGIHVYELTGNENRPAGKIRIDMRNMLGRFIEK